MSKKLVITICCLLVGMIWLGVNGFIASFRAFKGSQEFSLPKFSAEAFASGKDNSSKGVSFSDLNTIIKLPSKGLHQTDSMVAVTCGDFDGDGDLDLAGLVYGGKIIFIENKMHQKSSE